MPRMGRLCYVSFFRSRDGLGVFVSASRCPKSQFITESSSVEQYLCDTKECTNIRDDVHLNATHRNDFTGECVYMYISVRYNIYNSRTGAWQTLE